MVEVTSLNCFVIDQVTTSMLFVINIAVNVLEYNDVNFQEIENILLDYNINVENMWGLIR